MFQDCPAIQDVKGQRVRPVSPDSQEPMERKEAGGWLGKLVQEAKEVQRAPVVHEVQEAQQESQARREQQATTVHLAHPVREALKDPRVLLVSQDQRVPLDHLERMGCPVTLASGERLDSKAKLAHQDLEVLLDHRDRLEKPVQLVKEDILDPLVPPESRVFLALVEKKGQREIQVLRAVQEKTVHQDSEGSLEKEVFQE